MLLKWCSGFGMTPREHENSPRMNQTHQLLFYLLISSLLCISDARVPALLVFGDSVLDAGTNLFLINSSSSAKNPPYGGSYFGYPTGRYSDGRTIADFLAQNLQLPLAPPFLRPGADFRHGANFASAGSRLLGRSSSDSRLVLSSCSSSFLFSLWKFCVEIFISQGSYVSMETQAEQFCELMQLRKAKLGEDGARAWVNSSVFLIAIGSNDIQEYLSSSSPHNSFTRQQYVGELMAHYRSFLLKLYGNGARKIVILGLGPVGCFPVGRFLAARTRRFHPCLESANEFALAFNSGLRQLTFILNRDCANLQLVLAKPYDLLLGLIATPIRFGFLQVELACCGAGPFRASIPCNTNTIVCRDPSRFVFWDFAHLTEAADLFLLNSFWGGGIRAIEPYNLFRLTI